jgi:hypothetical protein
MSLTQLLNTAHAVLIEGASEEEELRLDRVMAGETLPVQTQAEAFLRARGKSPERGAPPAALRAPGTPPPMPPGIPLAPPGVIVREPEPTRGLEHLAAAFGQAPKPSRARPAVPRRG